MTDAARRQFYGSGEYRRLCERVTGKPWTDRVFLEDEQREYARRLEMSVGAYLVQGHWLDYGGSTGIVSRIWNPRGENIVADYGDGATVTPEAALVVTENHYDNTICCQTIDHLREPSETLQAFHRVTRKEGRLFVDFLKFDPDKPVYKLDHDIYPPTLTCCTNMVERAGWRILWADAVVNPTHWSILAEKS
jgi:hypothetical protein